MWTLREGGKDRPGESPEERGGERPISQDEHAIVCRTCGTEVSARSHVFAMASTSAVQVFPNPYGLMREIVTVRSAWSLRIDGPATSEFTWFSGYAWNIAYCAPCGRHLGWHYEAEIPDAEPRTFYGLLLSAIVET